jgi:protein-arginine kinase activator protein McsA
MAKAYVCDVCERIFSGASDMQLILGKGLEVILRFILGIKISPENEQADIYTKDLCPKCAKGFTEWYKQTKAEKG